MIGTINKILKKILGDKSQLDLKDINPVVEQIKQFSQSLSAISHDELRSRTEKLKQQIKTRIAPGEEEVAQLKVQAEALPGTELEQKEAIFAQIDKLEKDIDKQIEEVLTEILPETFAIVRETARRLKENAEIRLTASEFDRELATITSKDYVAIEGETLGLVAKDTA
jgi:preprotein translocase subunit SecA